MDNFGASKVSMDYMKEFLPHKLLNKTESTPVALTRLSTASRPSTGIDSS